MAIPNKIEFHCEAFLLGKDSELAAALLVEDSTKKAVIIKVLPRQRDTLSTLQKICDYFNDDRPFEEFRVLVANADERGRWYSNIDKAKRTIIRQIYRGE